MKNKQKTYNKVRQNQTNYAQSYTKNKGVYTLQKKYTFR